MLVRVRYVKATGSWRRGLATSGGLAGFPPASKDVCNDVCSRGSPPRGRAELIVVCVKGETQSKRPLELAGRKGIATYWRPNRLSAVTDWDIS